MDLEQIGQQLETLQKQAAEAVEAAKANPEQIEEVKALLNGKGDEPGLAARIGELEAAQQSALREEEFKAMQGELKTLNEAMEELRKPGPGFKPGFEGNTPSDDDPYRYMLAYDFGRKALDPDYVHNPDEYRSYYQDILLANKGHADARERLATGINSPEKLNPEGKAMTEGTDAQGGYLVRPQIERQLVTAIELNNVLRGLCSTLNVTTNAVQLDQLTLSTTAGWVAELATKPESTAMTLASVTANVFTAAGLATISNQLLQDSNPSIDGLVTADLAKRLTALEETAFIAGTGSGQPLGILNTPGLGSTNIATARTNEATDIPILINAILDAIATIQTNWGDPTAILMHPRTWTRLLKAQISTGGAYLIGQPLNQLGPDVTSPRTIRNPQTGGLQGTLWGYPVYTSNRVPTNLGGGTNESRVIVADFAEALILDRQGVTVDRSEHVFFTSNQTVLRSEKRVGFTAARSAAAWNVIGGVGLANG